MAKVISIVGSLSGKLAGTVYSHNRWGNYIRQLVIPTNPQTPAQSSQRGRIANAATDWSLLTDAQRLGWDSYATLITRLDRLGQPINYNGFTAFVMCHSERVLCAQGAPTDAPVLWSGTQPDGLLFNVTDDEMELEAIYTGGVGMADTSTHCLLAFSTAPQAKNAMYPKSWRHFYTSGKSQALPIDLTASWEAKFGPIVEADDVRYHLKLVLVNIVDAPGGVPTFHISSPVQDTVLSTTT